MGRSWFGTWISPCAVQIVGRSPRAFFAGALCSGVLSQFSAEIQRSALAKNFEFGRIMSCALLFLQRGKRWCYVVLRNRSKLAICCFLAPLDFLLAICLYESLGLQVITSLKTRLFSNLGAKYSRDLNSLENLLRAQSAQLPEPLGRRVELTSRSRSVSLWPVSHVRRKKHEFMTNLVLSMVFEKITYSRTSVIAYAVCSLL